MSSTGWALHPFLPDAAPIACPGISATFSAFVFLFALALAFAFAFAFAFLGLALALALALHRVLLFVLPLAVLGRRHCEICAAARQSNRHPAGFLMWMLILFVSGHVFALFPCSRL